MEKYLIFAAISLLVLFLLRKQLFINPIVRKMSEIVLNKEEEAKEDEI